MIRKCFTINPARTIDDIKSYEDKLIKTKIFDGCEIFYPYLASHEQYENYIQGVKSYLKYPNFEIVCHLPYGRENNLASYHNLDVILERLYKAIDFASMFNVKKLTLHPGELDGSLSREEATKLSIENVKKLSNYAKKYGMTIMIENLVGNQELCLTKEEMKTYLDSFDNHEVKLIFDCGHCNVTNGVKKSPINEFVIYLKDYLYHLHISDNNGQTDQHQKIGTGNIDFKSYLQTLKDLNYKGLYSFEVLFNDYRDLMNTANQLDDIAKQLN